MRCPRCSDSPSALEFVGHVERAHFGHGAVRWACQHCNYQSHSFNDAIAHCLLHNHHPQDLRMIAPVELIDIANQALALTIQSPMIPNLQSSSGISPEWRPEVNISKVHRHDSRTATPENLLDYDRTPTIPTSRKKRGPMSSRKRRRPKSATPPIIQEHTFVQPIDASQQSDEEDLSISIHEEVQLYDKGREEESESTVSLLQRTDNVVCQPEDEERRLECQQCRSSIKLAKYRSHNSQSALRHVMSCLKMKPYSCGQCVYGASQKRQVQDHMKKIHPGVPVNVELRIEERDKLRIQTGMADCFPTYEEFKWNGLEWELKWEGMAT